MYNETIETSANWSSATRFALLGIVLFGGLLPLGMAGLNSVLFPYQAKGSLLASDGVVIGSELIGQSFNGAGWFIGRPSAAGYDPRAAAGSNMAPSDPALRERMAIESANIAQREGVEPTQIPVDLLSASGGGLDPHISPESAFLQVARIAREWQLSEPDVRELVSKHIETASFGVFGQPRVNVLKLNLALRELRGVPGA